MMTTPENPDHSAPGYEKRDVHTTPIYVYGIILLVLTVLSMGFIQWLFGAMKERIDQAQVPPAATLRVTQPAPPSEPAFSMYPARTLAEFRQAEDAHLSTYGWVDRDQEITRLPVERAMTILLETGLPPVPAGEATP